MVIIGILAAIAAPRLSNSLALQRVEGAATRIVVDLQFAQRCAKTSNSIRKAKFDVPSQSYQLIDLPHPDHPGSEYRVFLADEPYGAALVKVDFGGGDEIEFDMYGVPDSGGSVVIRVGSYVRTITVDADTGKASAQ